MRLYTYWRSTTSYRVRIALALKGIGYESKPVNLVEGDQRDKDFLAINPSAGVPALALEGPGAPVLTQSMAILDYLEARYPTPALLPSEPLKAAQVRAAANIIACDIHPVNNLKVIGQLKSLGFSQDQAVDWMRNWMAQGFAAYQALIPGGRYSFGDTLSLADICLVPQLYNAHRWGLDLAPFADLSQIEARCLAHPAFEAARPENQPDAES